MQVRRGGSDLKERRRLRLQIPVRGVLDCTVRFVHIVHQSLGPRIWKLASSFFESQGLTGIK